MDNKMANLFVFVLPIMHYRKWVYYLNINLNFYAEFTMLYVYRNLNCIWSKHVFAVSRFPTKEAIL